ncbi:MAG TPA: hypothetical protein VMS21_02500 [Methylomirabilota bacterium]|nr:hypothetical protein [Methylomirabilota bacterium]
MPGNYTIFLDAGAAQYLFRLRRQEREPVRRFLDFLADYPAIEGETTERDAIGRTVQVKLLRHIKVVYWADHADKAVKILRLERLSRQ